MQKAKEPVGEDLNKIKDCCDHIRDCLERATSKFGDHQILYQIHQSIDGIERIVENHTGVRPEPPLQRPKSKTRKVNSATESPQEEEKSHKKRQRAKAPTSGELYCRSCGETETCEWRRGPDGYKSLCNACGIHFAKILKKEEKEQTNYTPKRVNLDMLLNTNGEQTL